MPKSTSQNEPLSERAQMLLKALVERYINDGQPVGSRALSKESGLELSPATIRNVMSDLEELELISSPHTSAGRVPTAKGYRLFIDSLVRVQPLSDLVVSDLQHQLALSINTAGTSGLLESASSLLSEATQMAGVVTVPRVEHNSLRQIEFLQLSDNRVLAILVVNEQEVQNKIIITDRSYSASELQQAANYLNEQFTGKDLQLVRADLFKELKQARTDMTDLVQVVTEMAEKVFEPTSEEDFVLAGQTNLMGLSDLSSMEQLRLLFDAFGQKRDILHLLDQCLNRDGLQIFIGEESGYQPLDACSVVTAPYEVDGNIVGVLGVIGPTRMNYERVIPVVDVTAKLLGAALNHRS